ncbi:hypothetical protein [Desertivibrio insolitus]|uniref:hypothetical protein n=1 Tax=Herbiconiux sp. SYSU D00978 TaxID=2812562 RepID=UPI001A97ABFA|nr:hypothetical protein [Herbiconiux sp. SYSU D00978]
MTEAERRDAWLDVLAELETAAEQYAESTQPWQPPQGLGRPPADLLARMHEVRDHLAAAIRRTSDERAAVAQHLATVRSASSGDTSPRYLDIQG